MYSTIKYHKSHVWLAENTSTHRASALTSSKSDMRAGSGVAFWGKADSLWGCKLSLCRVNTEGIIGINKAVRIFSRTCYQATFKERSVKKKTQRHGVCKREQVPVRGDEQYDAAAAALNRRRRGRVGIIRFPWNRLAALLGCECISVTRETRYKPLVNKWWCTSEAMFLNQCQHNGDKYRVKEKKEGWGGGALKCICGLMRQNHLSPFLLSRGYICTTASLWLVYSQSKPSDILHIDYYTMALAYQCKHLNICNIKDNTMISIYCIHD